MLHIIGTFNRAVGREIVWEIWKQCDHACRGFYMINVRSCSEHKQSTRRGHSVKRAMRFPVCQAIVLWLNQLWRVSLWWRHNGHDSVSNNQPHDCLPNRLFRRRSKKTSKPRVTGLCVGNSPGTGEFPAQMASNAENVSIWWRHHV